MLRVKSPQNLGAGFAFGALGLAGLVLGRDLPFGSAARMGSGFFPLILSGLILAIGIWLALSSLVVSGERIERMQWRPVTFVSLAILAFGFVMTFAGLAISAAALTLIAALARRETRWGETSVLAIVLGLFSVALFVYGLGQAMPAWWGN
jgi:hypothetical protein